MLVCLERMHSSASNWQTRVHMSSAIKMICTCEEFQAVLNFIIFLLVCITGGFIFVRRVLLVINLVILKFFELVFIVINGLKILKCLQPFNLCHCLLK